MVIGPTDMFTLNGYWPYRYVFYCYALRIFSCYSSYFFMLFVLLLFCVLFVGSSSYFFVVLHIISFSNLHFFAALLCCTSLLHFFATLQTTYFKQIISGSLTFSISKEKIVIDPPDITPIIVVVLPICSH